MSEGSRKKLSGAGYRKRRLQMGAERGKLSGSLKKFLKPSCSSTNPAPSNEEQLVAEPMVIDDQHHPQSTSETHIPLLSQPGTEVSNLTNEERESGAPIDGVGITDPST